MLSRICYFLFFGFCCCAHTIASSIRFISDRNDWNETRETNEVLPAKEISRVLVNWSVVGWVEWRVCMKLTRLFSIHMYSVSSFFPLQFLRCWLVPANTRTHMNQSVNGCWRNMEHRASNIARQSACTQFRNVNVIATRVRLSRLLPGIPA